MLAPPSPVPHTYAVRLEGRLDHVTSRWVWVVKWILVVPHLVVLVLLGVGAVISDRSREEVSLGSMPGDAAPPGVGRESRP